MRNSKADRRSRRTRQLLNAALLELMQERRYDEITVQDIIDRANVGRSTFYAHYLDKEDLLVSEFTRVLDELTRHTEQGNPPLPPSLTLFLRHAQTHHHLYKALVRGGGIELLYKRGYERLRQIIEGHLAMRIPPGHTPAAPLPLVADYLAGGLLNVLRWWLDHDMPYTPEQVDALIHQLMLPGLQATLKISLHPHESYFEDMTTGMPRNAP
jgi:AcrR family transcriptional regulator